MQLRSERVLATVCEREIQQNCIVWKNVLWSGVYSGRVRIGGGISGGITRGNYARSWRLRGERGMGWFGE